MWPVLLLVKSEKWPIPEVWLKILIISLSFEKVCSGKDVQRKIVGTLMSDVMSTVIVFEINYVVVIYWQEELALNISQLVLNFRNEKSGIVEETNWFTL